MRQGCPVSPSIFILQAEPLACAIRKNKNIIGFPLPNVDRENGVKVEVKLNANVDDSQFFNPQKIPLRKV